ncbi:hypothetical protein [Actinoallomurus sp. CA-142502]|uniref:hypothetical protein n=1 Tax=Actinoallomurus sp. CA-142502 TaxID=3239885 RepID=UPI003D8AEAC0
MGGALVRRFCAAWSNLNPYELAGYFAENAVYQNVPIPGIILGREAIDAEHDVDLPIMGVFELSADFGHFTSWTQR